MLFACVIITGCFDFINFFVLQETERLWSRLKLLFVSVCLTVLGPQSGVADAFHAKGSRFGAQHGMEFGLQN